MNQKKDIRYENELSRTRQNVRRPQQPLQVDGSEDPASLSLICTTKAMTTISSKTVQAIRANADGDIKSRSVEWLKDVIAICQQTLQEIAPEELSSDDSHGMGGKMDRSLKNQPRSNKLVSGTGLLQEVLLWQGVLPAWGRHP